MRMKRSGPNDCQLKGSWNIGDAGIDLKKKGRSANEAMRNIHFMIVMEEYFWLMPRENTKKQL